MTYVFYTNYYCTGTPVMLSSNSNAHGYACAGVYGSDNTCTTNKSKVGSFYSSSTYVYSYRTAYSAAYIAQYPWAATYNGLCSTFFGGGNYGSTYTVQPAGADNEFVVNGFCGSASNFQCKVQ